jgi:RNA polymerase sigma factor (sigma-70 family)
MTTDEQLLLQLKQSSKEAFDSLYNTYWEYVFYLAYKRLNDRDAAKDISQTIFLKLWQNRESLSIHSLPAYLYQATRNQVLMWMEKAQKYTAIPELLEQLSPLADQADGRLREREFMEAYQTVLSSFTPSQLAIYNKRFQENLSTDRIAEELHISRKTVQNQLARCLRNLRASLSSRSFFIF